MQDLWRLSAIEVAGLIRNKDVSAREVAFSTLSRLDWVNPAINAVVDHRPEDVLAQADAVDTALAQGYPIGPMAGVPVTVKINIDQVGYATTNGITLQQNLIAANNNPVVDNLRRAGAVILGRTNAPAFSYRWFTTNLLHGDTKNPRDASLTPGGSSGGAAAAVAAGIGPIAHGTDIAGSIRYPAYACGVHGLRPTLGRIPAYNASGPDRPAAAQITAVSGPIARTIGDLRLALEAMSQMDLRDPWWVGVPLVGAPKPKRAAICVAPDGLRVAPEVADAVRDAGKRLEAAGWTVDEITRTPPMREAAELQRAFWLGDGYAALLEAAEKEGDPGALACLNGNRSKVEGFDNNVLARTIQRRATLLRAWQLFLDEYAVLVTPVSGELPFEDGLDLKDAESFERVWDAQMPQVAVPLMGLPALAVSTGTIGRTPVGVQVISSRYREDLCLSAGEAIEAGGVPLAPVDPSTV